MARYDKDSDFPIRNAQTNIDKPKGSMSIRDAAAMEMPQQNIETRVPGTMVHGFGDGSETTKRHTDMGMSGGMMMNMGPPQQGTGEAMTELVERFFQLPFQAQLSVMRVMASRVLGAMDARDQEHFLMELRSELDKMVTGEESTEARSMTTEDIHGT